MCPQCLEMEEECPNRQEIREEIANDEFRCPGCGGVFDGLCQDCQEIRDEIAREEAGV
jgi:hypothetical protein